MKIVLSKLPKSGWWNRGIPKYPDNPAMQEGIVPNSILLGKERNALISAVKEEDEGEDVILEPENTTIVNGVNGHAKISTTADDEGECEACTI